ncbi:MAG: hypothetical protein KVP17_002965 [Porospora cf. gigantea B]|nr:MAG: hypothetical protein KVP17_002965 [Porospora cf. gigantea B]
MQAALSESSRQCDLEEVQNHPTSPILCPDMAVDCLFSSDDVVSGPRHCTDMISFDDHLCASLHNEASPLFNLEVASGPTDQPAKYLETEELEDTTADAGCQNKCDHDCGCNCGCDCSCDCDCDCDETTQPVSTTERPTTSEDPTDTTSGEISSGDESTSAPTTADP